MKNPKLQKRVIKIILTIILIAYCLMVWPGYLAHDYYTSTTNSSFSQHSDILGDYAVVEQYFVPQYSHLYGIQFALSYDENSISEEDITFLLCNENGETIQEKSIPIREIQPNMYYEASVKRIMNTNKMYCWKLVIPESMPQSFQILYTDADKQTMAVENQEFLIDEEYINENAQTVSQYRYLSHSDKALIIGTYWFGAIILYLIMSECVNRLYNKLQK